MIYYLTDVKLDCSELKKRNAVFSEAGTKRSLYIIDTFQEVVEVISLAVPTKDCFEMPLSKMLKAIRSTTRHR